MNYQTEPITMWFDRRLVLRKSPIQGLGTFAIQAIGAGELLIMVTGGIVFTAEDWQTGRIPIEAEMYNQASLAANLFIVTPKMFHYYINHSCDPNVIDLSRSANATQYVAVRHILADEEITADYYNETTLAVCECKSPRCRWTKPADEDKA